MTERAARDKNFGGIAQLVERLLCKQDVRSSNLLASTLFYEAGKRDALFKSAEGSVAQLVRARA